MAARAALPSHERLPGSVSCSIRAARNQAFLSGAKCALVSACSISMVEQGEKIRSEQVEKSAAETSDGGPVLKVISKRLRKFNKTIKHAETTEEAKATGKTLNEQQVRRANLPWISAVVVHGTASLRQK